jgi:hypothetical protein
MRYTQASQDTQKEAPMASQNKTVRLWKDGRLKEVARTMFSSEDEFQAALEFWYGEGWEEQ